MKLGHIALSVSNLNRSIAFYGKHFGLRCRKRYDYPDKGMTIALLQKGDIVLELFMFKACKALPGYRKTLDRDLRTVGAKHFSVELSDITGAYRRFKKARVPLATDLRVFESGARYFFLKDPDGILIEVMEKI